MAVAAGRGDGFSDAVCARAAFPAAHGASFAAANVPQPAIRIGVPGYSQPEDNRPGKLLAMPFGRQRRYWERPDGTDMETRPASEIPSAVNRMRE